MIQRRRKKKPSLFKALFFLIVICIVLFGIWQRKAVMRYADNVRRVLHVPDVPSILHSLRQEAFGILCMTKDAASDDCYVFDRDGIVFGSARTVVGDVIVRIDDSSSFLPILGEPLIESDAWANMLPVIRFLKEGNFPFSSVLLKRAQNELVITVPDSDTLIYISLEFVPSRSLRALPEFIKRVPFSGLKYIDLRAEGRIFYK